MAIVPGAPGYGYGGVAEAPGGDLYLVGGGNSELYRLRPGETTFTPQTTLAGNASTLAIGGDTIYIGVGSSRTFFRCSWRPVAQVSISVL